MPFIIEGLITTWNPDGTTNVAPQGPVVVVPGERLLLRPWQGSRTYANLWRDRAAVFHLTDDVLLLAETAIGEPRVSPPLVPTEIVDGMALANALESWELVIDEARDDGPRSELSARIVNRVVRGTAPGWNRAQFAVIETAILATRLHLIASALVRADLERWRVVVEKTGGERELAAFALLERYIVPRLVETIA
jgi:uncharacterized protein